MLSPPVLIFFIVFIDLIGFGIVLPLLPSYAAQFHASDSAIGMLVASFSLMQFLLAPLWGRLSDRIGRRPVLLVGLAGSSLSYLVFAVASSFWLLLVSRVVAGGMGATVNVAQAYLADVTPLERRAKAMGMIGAAFGLGFVVGPALGGVSSRFGNAAPGLLASGLTGLNFLAACWKLPESRRHRATETLGVPAHWSRFLSAFMAIALLTIAFTVMYVVFPLQVERALGYSRRQTAYLFVVMGLVSAVVQGRLVGRLVPRFGERALMTSGCLVLAAGMVALSGLLAGDGTAPSNPAVLVGVLLLLGGGSALIAPSASTYVSRLASNEEQGRALGLLTSVGAVARIVGPLMAGAITHYAGARTAFLVAGGAAGIGGMSVVLRGRRD